MSGVVMHFKLSSCTCGHRSTKQKYDDRRTDVQITVKDSHVQTTKRHARAKKYNDMIIQHVVY